MKPATFDYRRPSAFEDAIALRGEYGHDSVILAGGQSLIPMMNFRLARPEVVIDIGRTENTRFVTEREGGVVVGPMARQRDLEISPDAQRLNPLIGATLHHVAHAVVRNRGTVVGSIAHADAAAELPTLFTVLDGVATAASPRGTRSVTGGELFSFHLTNTLEPDEMLAEVWFPALADDEGYAYVEYARRHGDYALAGVCATIRLDGDRITSARLGYSGVATRPTRCPDAEAALAGQAADDAAFAAAADIAAGQVVEVGDDFVATQSYRQHLVRRLTQQALQEATERARTRRGS